MKYIKRYLPLAIAFGISAAILVAVLIISSVSKATVIKEHSDDNGCAPIISPDEHSFSHPNVHGIYVTAPTAGTEKMDELIDLINSTDLNAIVLDIKEDSGNISFYLDNPETDKTGACIPYINDIKGLLQTLHDNDIYVIGRISCFKDPVLAAAYPELALFDSTGEPVVDSMGNAWVNPCKQEVWDYVTNIAVDCALLGFDEIQLDYVRFPVGQNSEDAVYGVASDDESRQEYINSFLSQITSAVHEKAFTPVSANVFGTIITSDVDAKHIGQSYTDFASTVDCISPMIYPSHYAAGDFGLDVPDANPYDTIFAALSDSADALASIPDEDKGTVRPWLQAFTAENVEGHIEYNKAAINSEIQAVYDAGYDEWILWNSKSDYSVLSE
jgi:hypothetical protein